MSRVVRAGQGSFSPHPDLADLRHLEGLDTHRRARAAALDIPSVKEKLAGARPRNE
jgi:hypothetical protein